MAAILHEDYMSKDVVNGQPANLFLNSGNSILLKLPNNHIVTVFPYSTMEPSTNENGEITY